MALTKADIVSVLAEKLGLSRLKAKEIVEMFFLVIKQALTNRNVVKLSGFGSFTVRKKGERPGRNPRTGEPFPISERNVVTFKASNKLKSKVAKIAQPAKGINQEVEE